MTKDEIPDFLRLLSQFIKSDSPSKFDACSKDYDRVDLRIEQLLLLNVRQYSQFPEKGYKFALDFVSNGNPCSSVFLGANGTGKTTLFAALEYLYLGNSEIAASHGHSQDVLEFFRSINKTQDDILIEAIAGNKTISRANRIDGYEIPAAFCSECDYFSITRNWQDITSFVAKQIGFQEIWELLTLLRLLASFIPLAYEYNKRLASINEAADKRKICTENTELYNKYSSIVATLQKENKSVNSRFLNIGGSKYYKHISRFVKEFNKCLDITYNIKELEELLKYIEQRWQEKMKVLVEILSTVVPEVMKSNLKQGKENLLIKLDNGNLNISLLVRPGDETDSQEIKNPIEYFNTFRLKLFCVSFKLSLLCCAKIFHRLNLPFFVDDIFDSSDFNHRASIGGFIMKLLDAQYTIINDKALDFKCPLQIVFFTQDNIIGENVFNGLLRWGYDHYRETDYPAKFRRLYVPSEVKLPYESEAYDDSDIKKIRIDGNDVEVINIDDPI